MEVIDAPLQCRACLCTNSSDYFSMESLMASDYTILDCFNICTNLKAEYADLLPATICSVCSHDLHIAFDFLQSARQADAALRKSIGLNEIDEDIKGNRNENSEEKLEYVDNIEILFDSDGMDDPDGGDNTLELSKFQSNEKRTVIQRKREIKTIEESYDAFATSEELETIEEQKLYKTTMEYENLDEKAQVNILDSNTQNQNIEGTENGLVSDDNITAAESYPDDEKDDEYLIEPIDNGNTAVSGWKCLECKRVLHSDVPYEGHINMHRNLKPYKCTQCQSSFRCPKALKQHSRKRHCQGKIEQKCFTCDQCNKPFRLATLLSEHRRAKHKTVGSCLRCSKSFESENLLNVHMTLMHPPTNTSPILCPYCEQPPLTKQRLVEHLRLQHPAEYRKHVDTVDLPCDEKEITPWQCEECFRYYHTETLLNIHRIMHSNERPHTCSICETRFCSANNLHAHMRSIHQAKYEKRLQCKVCRKKFLNTNLEKHMLTHERKGEQQSAEANATKYLCAYCPQEFSKSKYLLMHEEGAHRLKRREPQHTCKQCGRRFFQKKHLQAHIGRVHTQVRRHVCNICGNAFKARSQLLAHMKLHMQKNLHCPHCDKKYARRADLTVHMRSHTGELPYACHLCSKRFPIKGRLTYHLQRHEGIKHPCSHCDAVYDNRSKLKEHMFRHTGMPYRCEECSGVEFARRVRFINHMSRVHERNMSDEELAQMFAKNTGKVIRFKQLDGKSCLTKSDLCDESREPSEFNEIRVCKDIKKEI